MFTEKKEQGRCVRKVIVGEFVGCALIFGDIRRESEVRMQKSSHLITIVLNRHQLLLHLAGVQNRF